MLADVVCTLVTNVDAAPVQLQPCCVRHLAVSLWGLGACLQFHYQKQLLRQLYRVLGSFTLLGNPVGLLENVGSGLRAFFHAPRAGAGPRGLVEEVGRGAQALLASSTYGLCNTIGNLSATLNRGLTALDAQAQQQSGVLQGVRAGVRGMLHDPAEAIQQQGLLGVVTGTGKGLLGMVTKPASGILTDTSRVMDGLKNAVQASPSLRRQRLPRYIYPDGVLTPFCSFLAAGRHRFYEVIPAELAGDVYLVHAPDNRGNYLFVARSHCVYVSSDAQVLWTLQNADLTAATHEFNVVYLSAIKTERLVVLQQEAIAENLCRLFEAIRLELPLQMTASLKRISEWYGEILGDEEEQFLQQMGLENTLFLDTEAAPSYHGELPLVLATAVPTSVKIADHHQRWEYITEVKAKRYYQEFVLVVECEADKLQWYLYRRYSDFV